jgi:hypothetical protein
MGILKPVLILAILGAALLFPEALATEPPPRVGAVKDASRSEPPQPQPKASTDPQAVVKAGGEQKEEKAEVKTDAKGKPIKPVDPPLGSKKPVKRRAVAAQLDDGLTPPTYRPRLEPVVPMPKLSPHQSAVPPGPVILNGCPDGACADQSGARYNPVGTTLISPQGRMCSNNGISVSCY